MKKYFAKFFLHTTVHYWRFRFKMKVTESNEKYNVSLPEKKVTIPLPLLV